ncbi:26S protease regulatory subunit 4-like [Durusdinium trenchii]|uniref:26S protease regulatory subunit 4-like n=1 Tax=Durusdinium trenchii TaxID=1381693 RepID=A0ABP0LGQ6_9DINO
MKSKLGMSDPKSDWPRDRKNGKMVEPRDLEEQIMISNQLQSAKVNTLMKSISHLQKENLSLQRGSREASRTSQYKKIQDELGQQDVLIDVLQGCIGTAKAQELMMNAIESLECDDTRCASCNCDEELVKCDDGSWLCKHCYGQRMWKEPPDTIEKRSKTSKMTKYPESKEKLQKECQAVEKELICTRRLLKAKNSPVSVALPKSALFNTSAALANILAGYVQRADQLEKENVSLRNHREQLENTLEEQEYEHRQRIQQPQEFEWENQASVASIQDLQTRLRLRTSEIDRAMQGVAETRQKLLDQNSKQEALRTKIDAAKNDINMLQEEMGQWSSVERTEHAKQLDKLQRSKELRRQHLLQGREQLKEAKTKLRKSLQSISDQRSPLEVQTKIKAQARRLSLSLRKALQTGRKADWSEFWSQLDTEQSVGLEAPVQELLDKFGIQNSEQNVPKLQELKEALYHMEVAGGDSRIFGQWAASKKKLQDEFRAEASSKLAELQKLETLLSQQEAQVGKLQQERIVARHDAAAEHCQEMMAEPQGLAPGADRLPVPARLLVTAPGSSAEEARQAIAAAKQQHAWEKRFLPIEEKDLPAIHLSSLEPDGGLADWTESLKLQAELGLQDELSTAPHEVLEMEDYVDKLDAVHTELQETVADLKLRLQAARVLLRHHDPKAGSRFCEHCPHCFLSN